MGAHVWILLAHSRCSNPGVVFIKYIDISNMFQECGDETFGRECMETFVLSYPILTTLGQCAVLVHELGNKSGRHCFPIHL